MLAINADDAAVLDALTLLGVLTARNAIVFLIPNRRAVRPVASGKLRRNMLLRLEIGRPRFLLGLFDRAQVPVC